MFSNEFINIIKADGNYANSMLNHEHMLQFMNLIPFLNMQATILLQSLHRIDRNLRGREFVQILFRGHSNYGHWICIWYDSLNNYVRIYDSLKEGLKDEHKSFISRLFPDNNYINVI